MPLIVEGPSIPTKWLERKPSSRVVPIDRRTAGSEYIRIALINNMPDAALEDTELQFFDLLDAASENLPVVVKLFSLTGVPRTDRGTRHLNSFYSGVSDLWNCRFDALIMTGTEPKSSDLKQEPYWTSLTQVIDWAEENTTSTILSCLAAHAGVLHSDGIERRPVGDKKFGVFESLKLCSHPLTASGTDRVRFPHSRWNEVTAHSLTACGYEVLTGGPDAGVDLFVKQKKKSLFVHFQGHPEYGIETLFKEYKRDVKRFLRGEREDYPSMPKGYFDEGSTQLLGSFQMSVKDERREGLFENFPTARLTTELQNTWRSGALGIYGNWLQYLLSKRESVSRHSLGSAVPQSLQRSSVDRGLSSRPAVG